MELLKCLENYIPYNEQESSDQKTMIAYVKCFSNIYERSNLFGHVTCSPWIVNEDFSKVLMIYHNIYDSWGWCGGHSDGERDLLKTACREGKEETGLEELLPLNEDIFSIEVLPVPPHKKHGAFVSSHVHLNFTFLCMADEKQTLRIKPDENSGVAWIAIEDIDQFVKEQDMLPVYHKLVEKSRIFRKKSL